MQFFGELFGSKKAIAVVAPDDTDIRNNIERYQTTLQSFQQKLDEHHSKIFGFDQRLLQCALFNQEKAVACLIERNDYEERELNKLKSNIDLTPHPIVTQLCFANYFLSLHCIAPQITHEDASSHKPTITYQYIADLARTSIRAESLADTLEKVTKLLSRCPNEHVTANETTFFNLHLRIIVEGAITAYQHYLNSFMTDIHLDKLHTTFNESFVPKAFYPLLKCNWNKEAPEKIFAQLIVRIVQAIQYLEQDPVHKNSLPCVEALTLFKIQPLNNSH